MINDKFVFNFAFSFISIGYNDYHHGKYWCVILGLLNMNSTWEFDVKSKQQSYSELISIGGYNQGYGHGHGHNWYSCLIQ